MSLIDELSFLNTDTGMEYCGEMEDIYQEVLESYCDDNLLEVLKNDFEAKDWANYRVHAHALKSVSLTIGAETLSEHGKSLEYAARDNDIDFILNNHEAIYNEYVEMIEKIRSVIS